MPKKEFSFHYNHKTKTGKMTIGKKYIDLNLTQTASVDKTPKKVFSTSSSGGTGYGINLI